MSLSEYRHVMHQLAASQKSPRGVSLYSLFINRPGGRVLAAGFALTPASPNVVTAISAVFTLCGIALVASVPPSPLLGVAVWLLLALGFMLDSADGQLARFTNKGSAAGGWLDHVIDAAKFLLIHTAVLVAWFRFFDLPDERLLLMPLLFQFCSSLIFVGGVLTELMLRQRDDARVGENPSRSRSVLLLLADYGMFCLVFLLLGWPDLFVGVYCALALVNAVFLVAFLGRWFRKLSLPQAGSDDSATGGVAPGPANRESEQLPRQPRRHSVHARLAAGD